MAVDKLKKIEILGYQDLREELVSFLQKLGLVQIIDFEENNIEPPDFIESEEIDTREVDSKLQQISYILNFIKSIEEKKGFLEALIEGPKVINQAKLAHVVQTFPLSECYHRCQEQESSLNSLHSQESKIRTDLEFWKPWIGLAIDVKELEKTNRCSIMAGTIDSDLEEGFIQELENRPAEITVVSRAKNKAYLLIIFLAEIRTHLADVLKRYEFQEVKFSGEEGTPAQIIKQLESQMQALKKDFESWRHTSEDLLKEKEDCLILYDYYFNLQKRQKVNSYVVHTRQVFSLVGWLKGRDVPRVLQALEKEFHEIDVAVKDPRPDETPPVTLINPKLASPFELITELYSLPQYKEFDPTPILAPFFFLFFGICLTDAAYGFILLVVSLLALRYLYLKEGARKLMQLFFLCGISTVICGALTGGWFGDLANYLPASLMHLQKLKNSLVLLDPIKDPLKFLILALSLGFVQVWFGIAVQMYKQIKEGDVSGAFLSRFPWLILLPGVIMMLLVKGDILHGAIWAAVAKWSSLLSAGTLFLFEGRSQKNILSRLGTGLLALYSIVGYYADMLSYCRLLALGLSTAVIANVVNQMAFLTLKIPYAGILVMAFIFIVGHIFNLTINLLGSFVHTSRLQFVEFFTKFFEGGGKPFVPLAIENKYVVIEKMGEGK